MEIVSLRPGDALWEAVAACAEDCSWRAGKGLAQQMREGRFQDWERVFALAEGTAIAGYCTLVEVDCLEVPCRPFIGYVFVGSPTGDSAGARSSSGPPWPMPGSW